MNTPQDFPRQIFTVWFQGHENAPELVRICHQSWVENNPEWTVTVITMDNIDSYVTLPRWAFEKLSYVHQADLLRLHLLEEYGGVWADATVFCNYGLDDWLPENTESGFFAFAKPARGYAISSWFLAATPGHPLVSTTRRLLESYWREASMTTPGTVRVFIGKVLLRLFRMSTTTTALWFTRPVRDWLKVFPYFALHYTFARTVRTDPVARDAWDHTPRVPASGPHLIQEFGMARVPDEAMRKELLNRSVPMYKLAWKDEGALSDPESALSVAVRGERSGGVLGEP